MTGGAGITIILRSLSISLVYADSAIPALCSQVLVLMPLIAEHAGNSEWYQNHMLDYASAAAFDPLNACSSLNKLYSGSGSTVQTAPAVSPYQR